MRIIIKGGIWKNTEDEILKAAVSKYGKNQWARISSLLVRKSPKQCKARWYEWLDPSIKKTEWSKEEDEKLLHLAKLMPTQWRTIAPIVGRTPSQCLERYQKLLDEAEAKEGADLGLTGPSGDAGPSADDVRRLRPGEIDPDPETKPARPDPVDMDEDEKEMLSEARARLANTQGKKAKRKAREKQLEEARRLASLQKRRELKAAGIDLKVKKKKKGMDYNADIPFEKKPAKGFYDTTEENSRQSEQGMTNVHLQKLEVKRRAEGFEERSRKRQKSSKNDKEGGGPVNFVPASSTQLNKLKQAEQISKRRKLVLPTPQVGEDELEEIVKIGFARDTSGLPMVTPRTPATGMTSLRTPRTPAFANPAAIKQLRNELSRLPAPKNDFEIVLPDVQSGDIQVDEIEFIEEDAADRDRKLREQQEAEERAMLSRISQVIQRSLPRPIDVNEKSLLQLSQSEDEVYQLINLEMVQLLHHDAVKYPVHHSKVPGGPVEPLEEFSNEVLANARKAIEEELFLLIKKDPHGVINGSDIPEIERFDEFWQRINDNNNNDDIKKDDLIREFQNTHEFNRNAMIKEATKAAKIEKKLNLTLGGYISRSQSLSKKVNETSEQLEQAKIELDSFKSLSVSEKESIPLRMEKLQNEVDHLAGRESELQKKYAHLSIERQAILERIEAMQSKKDDI
ncbi:12939_t:CDS:10 [Ambispora gerdemannii]|uniref:12939_t:CDS:1 n=1 Tax=Ambispora gerdemannii TaxID=144530 RepID=A0A9N9C9Y9_9GLOM|nr:12939_t:CDS:10 [Ambispora gerdemannii]